MKSGQTATSRTEENIAKVRQTVRENCWLTVRTTAEKVNIDRETVRKILTEDLANNSWILHYDNAPAHTALTVREFLASKQLCWNTLPIHRI
jgi:ribosomal protein S25